MNAIITDLMAVIGVVLNGLPQGLLHWLMDSPLYLLHWHFL